MIAPVLVIGYGNPARGDDAIGPVFIERFEQSLKQCDALGGVETLTDFQLQIEHALDLDQRDTVIFVDASVEAGDSFSFEPLQPTTDRLAATHAMAPAAVLAVFEQFYGRPAPSCWLLSIPAGSMGLGESLSDAADGAIDEAVVFLRQWLDGRA